MLTRTGPCTVVNVRREKVEEYIAVKEELEVFEACQDLC